jgi:Domain of unknown function (DUF4336)
VPLLVRHDANLWSSEYPLAWQGGLVPIPVRMTVIRLGDGRLIVHSPGPLSAELRAELDALGRVGFVVNPAAHGRFAAAAAQAWPSAQVLEADVPPAAWAGELETHLVQGFRLREVVLFHRPTHTLVITDLCFNIQRSDSRIARAFFRANGMWQRFGPSRIIRALAVSNRQALQRSLEQVLHWDFERIVPGHGDVIERGGPAALRAAWRLSAP